MIGKSFERRWEFGSIVGEWPSVVVNVFEVNIVRGLYVNPIKGKRAIRILLNVVGEIDKCFKLRLHGRYIVDGRSTPEWSLLESIKFKAGDDP